MPWSSVHTFTDPDEFAASLANAAVSLVVSERGKFAAKRTQIGLHRIFLQRTSESIGHINRADFGDDRAGIAVLSPHPGGGGVSTRGVEPNSDKLLRFGPGHGLYWRSIGRSASFSISMPLAELASLGTVAGHDLMPPKDLLTETPALDALARVRRLHETAGHLAEDAPAVLADPEAAWGFEQALTEALVHCLSTGTAEEDRTAQRHHSAIMQRFHRFTEDHLDEPLYIPELCKEIGTSLRTLNACCQEHLGMTAKHFLLLRRMHMLRRALRGSSREETTVTETATRYGFWQFGRLAVEYKTLFGESPSATLARVE